MRNDWKALKRSIRTASINLLWSKDFFQFSITCLMSNTFISNARLKLAIIEAKVKQHSEAELLFSENYSLSSSTSSSKKKNKRNEYLCLNVVIWLMTMKMKLKLKNRSKRYGISRPRSIHLIPKKHSLFVRKGISFYQNSLFVIEPFFVAFLK